MKKVVVLPSEVYESLRKPTPDSLQDPKIDHIQNLEKELRTILNSNKNIDEKRVLYQQTLQNLLNEVAQFKSPTNMLENIVTTKDEGNASDYIATLLPSYLPPTLKSKGMAIYTALKNTNGVAWNNVGEVIIDNEVVNGSNVIDLVSDLVRKWDRPPVKGWFSILNKLKSSNFPTSLIINPHRLIDLQDKAGSTDISQRLKKKRSSPYPSARKIRKESKRSRNWDPY